MGLNHVGREFNQAQWRKQALTEQWQNQNEE
jgi:hypothetical protein